MSKKTMPKRDDIEVINHVWAYNKTKNRFEFDNKTYEKDGKWYWLHNDKYVRDLDKYDIEFMRKYVSQCKSND